MAVDRARGLWRHFVAAPANRPQRARRGALEHYPPFSAGNRARTPVELVRHMTGLMGYVRTFFKGGSYRPEPLPTFKDEVARLHTMLDDVGELLASGAPCSISTEQLLQGPSAAPMTHAGQLAMLRPLA